MNATCFSSRLGWATLAALAVALVLWSDVSQGEPPAAKPAVAPKDRDLQKFMRQKLAASNQILEGLCTADMKLVKEGAEKLQAMSDAERWHVSNDALYKQASNEFRAIAKELIKAADENKPDRATLKWLDATVSCLDCHRVVRAELVVGKVAP